MSQPTLEERVSSLEKQLAELRTQLAKLRQPAARDWRRTVGMFDNDEGMKAIFDETIRLRELDRQRVRRRAKSKARPTR